MSSLPQTMTAIDPAAPGGPEVLVPVARPVPVAGQGEVLIPEYPPVSECGSEALSAAGGTPSGAPIHVWPTGAHARQAPTNGRHFTTNYK